MKSGRMLIGVDTGGTFTDLVLFEQGRVRIHKVLSTPRAPEQAIIDGLRGLGIALDSQFDLIHGSTVATNAVLESKGVKTAYVTNRGFADILTIGRQARADIYDLTPEPVSPPVPHELCLEIGGRITYDGTVIEDLGDQDLQTLKNRLRQLAPEAVAVNFLFSFIDDRFEKMVADALKEEGYFVTCSSDVLSEQGEYERGMATWLNAYVGPLMRRYLEKLSHLLPASDIRVMQSHGRTLQAAQAGKRAVNLLLSGPAGGVIAVHHLAEVGNHNKALSFDMGGTSTDVSMIDKGVALTGNGRIRQYPIAVPMVDIHTIGAGGSSIAYIDDGGLLQVGPESAGADPGPACYGKGGHQPTVTDANLLLGRLPTVLGKHLRLSVSSANEAFAPLADALHKDTLEVAAGVIDIVNEQMTQALNVMSAQKGYDPAEFLLVGFGAAGGLHVCALAENMQIASAMVPVHAGVLSALGMLTAEQGVQRSQTVGRLLESANAETFELMFRHLHDQAEQEMHAQGVTATTTQATADLRYQGQWHCLNLAWQSADSLIDGFHQAHKKLHGYHLDLPVEFVTARVQINAEAPLAMATALDNYLPPTDDDIADASGALPIFSRATLGERIISGSAIIIDTVSTTYVKEGWQARLDKFHNLRLDRQ